MLSARLLNERDWLSSRFPPPLLLANSPFGRNGAEGARPLASAAQALLSAAMWRAPCAQQADGESGCALRLWGRHRPQHELCLRLTLVSKCSANHNLWKVVAESITLFTEKHCPYRSTSINTKLSDNNQDKFQVGLVGEVSIASS